jgi:acetyltransferase-like isoleucine patch superfamily enzyme
MFKRILKAIYLKFGPPTGPRARMLVHDKRFASHRVGHWSYGRPKVLFANSGATLTIGKFVSIADQVTILLGGEHRVDWVTTYPLNLFYSEWRGIPGHPHTKGDVVIGNDVWIGRGATILSGIRVGDGAVIGAGAVVGKDVAPYSIVIGNPARHLRYRFDAEVVEKLTAIRWWDWPEERINAAVPLLLSGDVGAFLQACEE